MKIEGLARGEGSRAVTFREPRAGARTFAGFAKGVRGHGAVIQRHLHAGIRERDSEGRRTTVF